MRPLLLDKERMKSKYAKILYFLDSTTQDLEIDLNNQIRPDEDILWKGKPEPGIKFKLFNLFLIPFSFIWTGISILWVITILKQGGYTAIMALLGIPFVLLGIYLIIGRFFFDSARRKNTIYGITNTKIVIISRLNKVNIMSIKISTLTNVSFIEKSNGSGTIILGAESRLMGWSRSTGWPGVEKNMAPSIEMINDVKDVYDLIIKSQENEKLTEK